MSTDALSNVTSALTEFHRRYLDSHAHVNNALPVIEADAEWPSPCEQGKADDEYCYWKPVACHGGLDFSGMEQALNITLHPDLKMFYTSFYSNNLTARCADGDLELLQPWNKDDFERLQENLIGHTMMKRKRHQPETFFIAATDDDEIIISVINETGEVWAERVGQNPHRKLADSIADFINTLDV